MEQTSGNRRTFPAFGAAVFVGLLCLSFAISANAELAKKPAQEKDFNGVEYKILLDIKGLSAEEPIEKTLEKIAASLDMFEVGSSAGHRKVTYLDTEDGKLGKSHYILRVFPDESNPGKSKVTFRGRWEDISQAETLEGPGFKPSKLDIDYSGGKSIHSVSYNLSLDKTAEFPDGKLTGEAMRKNIAKKHPDLGNFLDSILGKSELIVPGIAVSYGTSVTLKPGQLTSAGAKTVELDVVYCGKEGVIVELSYGAGSLSDKEEMAVYEELSALLKKKGLFAEKQMPKTQSFLDHFLGGKTGKAKGK